MLGGGAGGASFTPSAGRRTAPSVLWAFGNYTAYPCIWCPPAVGAGGVTFAGGVCDGRDRLYSRFVALDPAGALLWTATHANASLNYESTPALTADGAVLFGNNEGTVALDAATGAERWRGRGGGNSALTLDAGGTLWFVSNQIALLGVRGADGSVALECPEKSWSTEVSMAITSAILIEARAKSSWRFFRR